MRAIFERLTADASRFFLLKRRHDPRFEFNWHYHREYELTLIVKSHGRRFVGDHIDGYGDGDLVLLGPNLPHTWCSAPAPPGARHDAVVVQFPDDLLGPGRLDGLKLGPVRDLLDRSDRGVSFGGATAAVIAERMLRLDRLSPLGQLAELLAILDELSRSDDGQVLSSRTFVPQLRPEATHPIDRVCKFLNDRFLERIPLGQAARVLGMSPSAFSRFFRRTTGKTFTGYVNELRIGHACRLLMETERGIADVAGASGFTNLSHFNRLFLRSKKMRPSEYRREVRRYQGVRAA
jgi:AraC-like DNA-binding protein